MKIIRIVALMASIASILAQNCQAKYVDDKADLVYYGYRYYSPTLGRWINRDSLGDFGSLTFQSFFGSRALRFVSHEPNLYEPLNNDPLDYVDVYGQNAITVTLPIVFAPVDWPVLGLGAAGVGLTYCLAKNATTDCDQEWANARRRCEELLSQPNPPRGQTGGYSDIENCAKGFVTAECGGNPVAPAKGPRGQASMESNPQLIRALAIVEELIQQHHYEEAIRHLDEIGVAFPNEIEVWKTRAFVNGQSGARNEAVSSWTKVIGLCDREPHYFYMRGIEFFHLSQFQEAVLDFTKVIELCDFYRTDYYRNGAYFFRADAHLSKAGRF